MKTPFKSKIIWWVVLILTFGAVYGATDTENFTVEVTEARVWELPTE